MTTIGRPYHRSITTIGQPYHRSITTIGQPYHRSIATIGQPFHRSIVTIDHPYHRSICTRMQPCVTASVAILIPDHSQIHGALDASVPLTLHLSPNHILLHRSKSQVQTKFPFNILV